MASILLIEDDEQLRRLLREVLERAGYQIREAPNGQEGIRSYRMQPADLIICDLAMPGKGGIQTLQELLPEFPSLKAIMMSGFTQQFGATSRVLTSQLGVSCILAKPFDLSHMLELVEQLLVGPISQVTQPGVVSSQYVSL
ncbi:MAG: response regulator [Nitrospirae bacterium]|nr:MAG: response regulator [Nitrospirota bacterium]